ncbi:hypothetical protein JOE38_001960 [Clavibacter michiganensis]|uniref:hypothetical protein n=1 Tax=Clavibacter michiganensis TaxID=28447 RepID=UPI0019565BA5|nr:hypothetical protein [Clavibacter michiganensis]MBM7412137.1 hypothetical protein [Clavibacter michiganensis]
MSTRGTDAAPPRATTGRPVGRRRWLAALLALLTAGTAVLLGAGFWSAIQADVDDPLFVALAVQTTVGLVALSLALSVGQVEVHRAVGPATEGRRPVALLVVSGITGALAIVATVAGVIAGLSAWITIGFLLGLVGMSATSWLLGHRTRLRSETSEAEAGASGAGPTPDLDWTPAVVRRKVRRIVVVGLLAGLAAAAVAVAFADELDEGLAEVWPIVLQLAFTASALTCAVVSYPAQAAAAPIVRDLSPAERKAVGRRTSGKGDPLAPRLERRAARLAAVSVITQRFQLTTSSLIAVAAVMTFVRLDADGPLLVIAIVLAVLFVAFIPYAVMDVRRRGRYAASTRELARVGADADGVTAS